MRLSACHPKPRIHTAIPCERAAARPRRRGEARTPRRVRPRSKAAEPAAASRRGGRPRPTRRRAWHRRQVDRLAARSRKVLAVYAAVGSIVCTAIRHGHGPRADELGVAGGRADHRGDHVMKTAAIVLLIVALLTPAAYASPARRSIHEFRSSGRRSRLSSSASIGRSERSNGSPVELISTSAAGPAGSRSRRTSWFRTRRAHACRRTGSHEDQAQAGRVNGPQSNHR
jgi:hypothetical protein